MSRKNIKCDETTYRALKAAKRDGETWDEMLQRLVMLDRASHANGSPEYSRAEIAEELIVVSMEVEEEDEQLAERLHGLAAKIEE